jgi:predicted DNA-binding protein
MPRFSRESFDKMISLRVTADQDQLLERLAQELGLRGKADVLRTALDYWLEHAPEAQTGKKGRRRDEL